MLNAREDLSEEILNLILQNDSNTDSNYKL